MGDVMDHIENNEHQAAVVDDIRLTQMNQQPGSRWWEGVDEMLYTLCCAAVCVAQGVGQEGGWEWRGMCGFEPGCRARGCWRNSMTLMREARLQ